MGERGVCAYCGEKPGRPLGPEWPEDQPVCEDCYDGVVERGEALPADGGGMLYYAESEEHPFRDGRYTLDPLAILWSSTPDDKTSEGGVPRVLARGKSGKLGVRALIESIYVSKAPPLEPAEGWTLVAVFDLPGLYELAARTKSNDTVLREALATVEAELDEGHWALVIATPRQLAWDLFLFKFVPDEED